MIAVYQQTQSYMDRLQAIVHAYKKKSMLQIIKLKLNIEIKNTTNTLIL